MKGLTGVQLLFGPLPVLSVMDTYAHTSTPAHTQLHTIFFTAMTSIPSSLS